MIQELTELGTMITVILGATAGVRELLAQRGFRSQRQELELAKLRLEVEKMRSELGMQPENNQNADQANRIISFGGWGQVLPFASQDMSPSLLS